MSSSLVISFVISFVIRLIEELDEFVTHSARREYT